MTMQQTIVFDKDHSVKAAVADAWGLFARTWKRCFKASWLYLILAGSTQALLFEQLLRYESQRALPAQLMAQMGYAPELTRLVLIPDWLTIIYAVLSALLALITTYACVGRLTGLAQYYKAWNVMPRLVRPALSRDDRRTACRLLLIDLLTAVVVLVFAALFALLAIKVSKWTLVLFPLLLIYVASTRQVARVHYAFNRLNFKVSLAKALRHSLGTPLVVQILTWIPAALLAVIFTLPAIVYALATLAASESMLRDDPTTLPAWLPVLFFVINTLCFAVLQVVAAWRFWALGMKCRG